MYLKAKPQHEDQSQKPDRAFLLDVARQILVLSNVLSNKTIFVGTFCKFSSCQCGNFLSNLTIFVFASTIAQWLMGDGRITWNRILEVGEMWGACISSCLKSNRLVSHHQWWHCGIDLIWCEVFGGTVTQGLVFGDLGFGVMCNRLVTPWLGGRTTREGHQTTAWVDLPTLSLSSKYSSYSKCSSYPNTHHIIILLMPYCRSKVKNHKFENDPLAFPHCAF